MAEINAGMQSQSLFEYAKDQEFEFAGLRMPLRDLIQLCPVKHDESRMTPEAMDQFTLKIYEASGQEVPEQFVHLLEIRQTKQTEGLEKEQDTKIAEKTDSNVERDRDNIQKGDDADRTNGPEIIKKDIARGDIGAESQEDSEESTHGLNIIIEADGWIAEEMQVPKQEQKIREAVVEPSEDKLAEVVAHYDALYRQMQQEVRQEGVEWNGAVAQEENATELQNSELTETTVPVEAVPVSNAKNDLADLPKAEAIGGKVDDLVLLQHELSELSEAAEDEDGLEAPETAEKTDIKTEMQLVIGQVITKYESVLAAEPALDQKLDELFVAVPETAAMSGNEVAVTIQTKPISVLVHERIEAIPEESKEQKEQAVQVFTELEALSVRIADLEIVQFGQEVQSQENIRELREKMVVSVRQLFELLEIEAEDELVQRFVDRLIIERLEELKAEVLEEFSDEGTHEHKIFEDNLQWLRSLPDPKLLLVRLIGRLAVV